MANNRSHALFGLVLPFITSLISCGEDTADRLVVSPGEAEVATCRTLQLTASPADNVTWSVDGPGTIMSGLYQAPLSAPDTQVTIIAEREGARGSASLKVATAFPEPLKDVLRVDYLDFVEHVHPIAARGLRVYALVEDDDGPNGSAGNQIFLVRSDDGGLTWSAPVELPEGDSAPSLAIDAADPDTLYVVLHTEEETGTGHLFLLTSSDGGKQFVQRELFVGGPDEARNADVASPSPGHVVVTAPAVWYDADTGGQGSTLLVWSDTTKGAGFGRLVAFDNGFNASWVEGTEFRLASGQRVENPEAGTGPQLATNAAGKVCLTSSEYATGGDERHTLRCATNGGPLGSPVTLVQGPEVNQQRLRIAMSADGQLVVAVYNAFADIDLDPVGETRYIVSTNGGQSFSAPKTLPGVRGPDDLPRAVYDAEVMIDADGVIWFSRTLSEESIQVDKSCDQGQTLSGGVEITAPNSLRRAHIFKSDAGLFLAAQRISDTDTGLATVRLLAP